MSLSTSDILRKAAELIEPEGCWAGSSEMLDAPRGVHCASTAILHVALTERSTYMDTWQSALFALNDFLDLDYSPAGGALVPDWNDAPGRTQAEVVAALRAAAEVAS